MPLVLTMDSEMFFGYILLEFMIKKPYPNYFIIKNVSSSTTHKKTPSFRLYVFPSFRHSFREFKKILPNTFIYESILIKIYMNTNIINTKIFHLNKYDLKVH